MIVSDEDGEGLQWLRGGHGHIIREPVVTHFRPRPGPTIAVTLGVLILVLLGCWQLRRDRQRNVERVAAIEHQGEAPLRAWGELPPWREVEFTGRWGPGLFLGSGVVQGGVPGYEVYGVFEAGEGGVGEASAGGDLRALVYRGWLPVEGIEELLVRLPAGPETIHGRTSPLLGDAAAQPLAHRGQAQVYAPGGAAGMASAAGAKALVVAPEAAIADLAGQPLVIPSVPERDSTSLAYALQWFSMAGLLLAFWARSAWRTPT